MASRVERPVIESLKPMTDVLDQDVGKCLGEHGRNLVRWAMGHDDELLLPPSKVKVGSTTYTISFDTRDWKTRSDCWGNCDHEKQVIHIEPDLAADMVRKVVLHEVLHACFQEFHQGDKKLEPEEVCRGLESALLMVLRDNPKLVRWLTAELVDAD